VGGESQEDFGKKSCQFSPKRSLETVVFQGFLHEKAI
jgi:hypothetical protein